jgi:uncharacterized protein (TIGR00369 family)
MNGVSPTQKTIDGIVLNKIKLISSKYYIEWSTYNMSLCNVWLILVWKGCIVISGCESKTGNLPLGFEKHFRSSPLTSPWEPIYSRKTNTAVIIGVHVRKAHTNARGFAHGGFISTLADNAMGLSCLMQLNPSSSLVTINLAVDFLGMAKIGQWLEIDTVFLKIGATICFAQAFVLADATVCAKANASFRVLTA